jgi:hypothetical protein
VIFLCYHYTKISNRKLCSLILKSQPITSKSINIHYKFSFKYTCAKVRAVDYQCCARRRGTQHVVATPLFCTDGISSTVVADLHVCRIKGRSLRALPVCARLGKYRTGGANVHDRHACAIACPPLLTKFIFLQKMEINQHKQKYKLHCGHA